MNQSYARRLTGPGVVSRLIDHPPATAICSAKYCPLTLHPEFWWMCVTVDQGEACGDISQATFNAFHVGERVQASYTIGGLTSDLTLVDVQPSSG